MRANVGWLAKNGMARHRPVFMAAEASLFLVGCCFWVDAVLGGKGFDEATWGALAYSVPALFWAGANMSCAALTLVGLVKPVRNWMVIVGASLASLQYMVLSYSAIFDGGASVIGLFALLFFLPLHLWLIFEAATYDGL